MNDGIIGALIGLGAGLAITHLVAFIMLRRLTKASQLIQYKRSEADLVTFLLERTEERLKHTQECADQLFKALHKTAYYCDAKYFDEEEVHGAFDMYEQVRDRNVHIG